MKLTTYNTLPRAGLLLAVLLVLGSSAGAATLTVDSLDDTTLDDGFCTLREAITNANDDAMTFSDCPAGNGDDIIDFAVSGSIVLDSRLTISDSDGLTIDGGQAITVDGNNAVQVFYVDFSGALQLEGLTVANGYLNGGSGGGLESYGSIHINRCTFFGNRAHGGGALRIHLLFNGDTASINNSSFYDNTSTAGGGAVNTINDLLISNSVFYNNSASNGQGGALGISNSQANVTISNSTFTGNNALYGSAIMVLEGNVTLLNNTISGNTSPYIGGAAISKLFYANDVILHNTIVSGNTEQGGVPNDINDPLDASSSYNLIGTGGGLSDGVNGNIVGVNDPGLDLLADNGGPTLTMALLDGSLAIDRADDMVCLDPPVNDLDQRGVARPQGDYCDIGAYELISTPPDSISLLMEISDIVSALPSHSFDRPSSRHKILNRTSRAINRIQHERLRLALRIVERLIKRTDGCALRGSPDPTGRPNRKDWIVNCDDQLAVYDRLIEVRDGLTL